MIDSFGCVSRSSARLRKVKSPGSKCLAEVQDPCGQGHAINEPSGFVSALAYLETQMLQCRWTPVQIGLHETAALRPWMLVPELLIALAAEVRLTYIGVSKTNDLTK
ncbi:Hypothetical_protein [Hexamita inflata]|uniref:Hypothetical_protein n=1 Tax=Hexamita inflata TaxID=28002 RepID=A0AA86NL14_9EUKA|nr:Hypothetical protein HINF_LOCUS8675 [Hexamita inflata]